VRSLPKLNYRSQALRQAMYAAPDAVFRRWLRAPYAADGWRIDVAKHAGAPGHRSTWTGIGGHPAGGEGRKPRGLPGGENFFDASHNCRRQLGRHHELRGLHAPVWYWLSHFQVGRCRAAQGNFRRPLATQALADTWQAYRAAIPWQLPASNSIC